MYSCWRLAALLFVTFGFLPVVANSDTLIVLNKGEASASLIDLTTNKVVATVSTGPWPHEIAVSSDGKLGVVSNYGSSGASGSSLTVIDIPEARVLKTIDLGIYRRPHGIQWLQNERCVVTVEGNKAVIIVDIPEGQVKQEIVTNQEASHMVALGSSQKKAYVTNIGSGTVTVVDLEKGTAVENIPTGRGAEGIDVSPDGHEVWITNRAVDTVSILDTSTLKITHTLDSKSFPIRVKITPDGKFALVSNAGSGDITVFDRVAKKEVRRLTIPLESASSEGRLFGERFGKSSVPIGILIQPDGKRGFVASANADLISVLDLEQWQFTETLQAGKEPDGLGYSPQHVHQNSN